jgi:transcriptional regulator with XRE-family HTH domain
MTVETSQGVIPQWTVPDKIRKAREHAGLSQQELADRLSVTRTSVVNWERGHTRPLRLILRLLAAETGVDEQWLSQEGPLISLHTDIPAGIPGQPAQTPTRGDAQGWADQSRPVAAALAGSRSPDAGLVSPLIDGKTPGAEPRLGTGATTGGHAVIDNDITRTRKRIRERIPLNPALALVLRLAA